MIRFGVFILLVFVGTELSAFSHFQQVPNQNGGGSSPSDDSSAAKEAKAKFEQSLNACEGNLSAENYKSVLEAFESLDAKAKKAAEEKMEELAKELEEKAQEEIDKDLNEETAEEIAKRVEEVMKQAELLGPQKEQDLLGKLKESNLRKKFLSQRHTDIEQSIKLARANHDEKALLEAQKRLELAEKLSDTPDQKKAVAGLKLTLDRALSGFSVAGKLGVGGGNGAYFADGANALAHWFSGQTALPEIPTNPPSAKNSGSGAGGGSSGGGGSATSFRNNSSSSPAATPSHSQNSDRGSSPSTSTETNSSGSVATSSKPSAATPPSSSSGGGVASAVTPSATPTPSPAPAPAGQSSSPLANNAVSGSGAGRGTSPATQPHGAPISKNPSAENGETKSAKKPTGSNSDVGSILVGVPPGASAMPLTVAAGSVPVPRRGRGENSAGTTTAEPLATAGGERNQKSGNRPGDPVQPTNVYSVRDKDLRPGGTTGEGLIKNTGQPTSSVKIADNATDTSASGDNNQSSPVTSTSNQGKPSYNWRENGRELQPLATNDLNTNELRVPPLEATGFAVNSLNTNDNPAPNIPGDKSQTNQNNTPAGPQEKLALYTKGLAQDALMVAALGSPSPRGNPKTTTGGLTQFAASNTNTVITMPPITKDTAARGLAAKTKPTPKKTGVAAQAPKRSIASVTPKASAGFVVRGFREIRGLLGAR